MTGRAVRESIQGQSFNDVLNELHAHTFSGSPGESDPFTLGELDREYIAFALALYYQCGHCQVYHGKVIERLRAKAGLPDWPWQAEFVKIALYLRTSRASVSELEWTGWVESWRHFAGRIHHRHPGLACATAYAVGIARADESLMDMAFESLKDRYPDPATLLGVIRDIDRVVVFMKAATSKNRTDPIVRRQLGTCGVRV
jgi:AhpD family alkylhydroperoxidase